MGTHGCPSLLSAGSSLIQQIRYRYNSLSPVWRIGGAIGLLLLIVFRSIVFPLLTASVWILWAAGLAWAAFHPKALFACRSGALRWAGWITLLMVLATLSVIDKLSALTGTTLPPGTLLFSTVLITPVYYLAAATGGLLLAAPLTFFTRRHSIRPQALVTAGWLGAGTSLLLTILASRVTQGADVVLLTLHLPLSLLWTVLERHPHRSPAHLRADTVQWLEKLLVVRQRTAAGVRQRDYRGAFLGSVAAVIVMAASALQLLAPAQGGELSLLAQMREVGELTESNDTLTLNTVSPEERRMLTDLRNRVVLVQMDGGALWRIAHGSSEARVLATAVTRLSRWGARRIFVMEPAYAHDAPVIDHIPGHVEHEPITESVRLEDALRSVPRVVLVLHQNAVDISAGSVTVHTADREEPAARERLLSSAANTAIGTLGVVLTGSLPAVPLDAEQPNAAVQAAAALQNRPPFVASVPGNRRRRNVAGKLVWTIQQDLAMVRLPGVSPDRTLPSVPLSSLLGEGPITVTAGDRLLGRGSGPTLFKDKVVFVASQYNPRRASPVGTISQIELLAHAAIGLAGAQSIRSPAVGWSVLWILFVGIAVGYLTGRRGPLEAMPRLAAMLIVIVGVMMAGYFAFDVWVDAIAPAATAVAAFGLSTQLTYVLERQQREQNLQLLQRFVPPQAIDEILEDPEKHLGLGGTRRRVVVLFADIRGFSRYAESHSPHEVVETINRYLSAMTDAVYTHNGLLDKYTGDGLMALFPVGENRKQDVERSLRAAIAMRDAAANIARDLAAEGKEPLEVGIGLHYGEAVIGLMGSEVRSDFTAIGHTVVLSQRLQGLAAGGEVVVSEDLAEAAGISTLENTEDPVLLKGLTKPVRFVRLKSLPPQMRPQHA
jgi:class 3 adenylate cyclase